MSNLRDGELARLVDHPGKARHRNPPPAIRLTQRRFDMLNSADFALVGWPTRAQVNVQHQDRRTTLPRSTHHPLTSGGSGNFREGIQNGPKSYVRRVAAMVREEAIKVRSPITSPVLHW